MSSHNRVRNNTKMSMYTLHSVDTLWPKVNDPFARLPNELFDSILKRLEIQKLIPLRLVNTRWLLMIESMCQQRKSLALGYFVRYFVFTLKDRFDGHQLDLSRLVALKMKLVKIGCFQFKLSPDLCVLLGKLFPSVEHLFVDDTVAKKSGIHHLLCLWPASLVTLHFSGQIAAQNVSQVCAQINAMTNLRHLDFPHDTLLPLASLSPTLERLHSFSFCMFTSPQATCDVLVSHLGPNCSKLTVHVHEFNRASVNRPIRAAQAPITHLHLTDFAGDSEIFIFSIFPRHFAATLKSLHITDYSLYLHTPSVQLAQLSILTQLNDIWLDGQIEISLSPGDAPPTPMPNIRSIALFNFTLNSTAANKEELFCRFFSSIFPNLERLTLRFWDVNFGDNIRSFLCLFKALSHQDILCLYSA